MGNPQERKRQDKQRRKQAKEKRRDARDRANAAQLASKQKQRHKDAFGTLAWGWPTKFRKLQLVRMRPIISATDLKGTEVQLQWFDTIEDRRNGANGEIVSAMEVVEASLLPDPGGPPIPGQRRSRKFHCTALLHEMVRPGSTYREWMNIQDKPDFGDDEGADYRSTTISFRLDFCFFTESEARTKNRFMRSLDSLQLIGDAWNVTAVVTDNYYLTNACPLTLDRLYELAFMLRIRLPRVGYRPLLSKAEIIEQLERLEARESELSERLRPLSAATIDYNRQWCIEHQELLRQHHELSVRYNELDSLLSGPDAAHFSNRRRRDIISDRSMVASKQLKLEAEMKRHDDVEGARLFSLISAEWPVANELTRTFLHWQELWEELQLVEKPEER